MKPGAQDAGPSLAPALSAQEQSRARRIGSSRMTTPDPTPADPEVERYLLLLAAQRSPRTVDAYRRDLAAVAAFLGAPVGTATTHALDGWVASMRAAGLAPSTIARRIAAVRSYFRHQLLLGAPPRQPRRGGRDAAQGAQAAAHALAVRVRAPDRGGERHDTAGDARPRPRRAHVRGRAPRLGDGRPRPHVRRHRRAHRPRARQGRQGAHRPARPAGRRGGPPLPGARPAAPRPALPAGSVPERAWRGADPGGRLPDPAQARGEGRARARARPSRTCSATRSRRTCSREVPTSARCRRCSGTQTSRRRSGTRTSPIAAGARRTSRRIPHARRPASPTARDDTAS